MNGEPKGALAARLRQRKFALLRRFAIPQDLLPGSLTLSYTSCGKPTCHCAKGKRHPAWTFSFMVQASSGWNGFPPIGPRRCVNAWRRGRAFQNTVREVLAANAELPIL